MSKLKFFLLGVLFTLFLVFNFSNANYYTLERITYSFTDTIKYYEINTDGNILCISPSGNSYASSLFKIALLSGGFDNNNNIISSTLYGGQIICFNESFGIQTQVTSNYNSNRFYIYSGFENLIINNCDSCDYSGYVLESVYNSCLSDNNNLLSTISGYNDLLNSCSNNLNSCNISLNSCLSLNCPDVQYTGDLSWSNIYINNILHPGRQFVNIDIPDYITWDYSVDDYNFDLYVGSGYDVDYINSIVDINSYRPTSDDFTSVFVGGLTLIMPYIIFLLFLLFMGKLVKRIFK